MNHVTIGISGGDSELVFDVPVGDTVQEFIDHYDHDDAPRVKKILTRAVVDAYKHKARYWLRRGVSPEEVYDRFSGGEWMPGDPMPKSRVDELAKEAETLTEAERKAL